MFKLSLYYPTSRDQRWGCYKQYTLNTPGSDLTQKGSHLARPISGSDTTRKPGQTDPESEPERNFWLRFCVSFTQIPDQSDPEMGLAKKMGPFPGQIWPGSF